MPPIGKGNPKSCVRIQGLGSKVTKKTRDPTNIGQERQRKTKSSFSLEAAAPFAENSPAERRL